MSNLDPEAPEKSSEFRLLSACGHPPERMTAGTSPLTTGNGSSSGFELCACAHCTLPNTSTRQRAGRMVLRPD